jgi:hypothetical protein
MNPLPPRPLQVEEHLAALAMKFRGTRREAERRAIAAAYAETVQRLIHSASWHEMPPPEDQLPELWMPTEFFEYWARHQAASQ